ncbi:MAG TPA: toll/interleukin-1 receptor domain-containing protein [Pyrinomonadaceae bacterium]|nr:toll/interleukin-1 receptor domain-containing protein [Pyrinomonadaceae bacterium]
MPPLSYRTNPTKPGKDCKRFFGGTSRAEQVQSWNKWRKRNPDISPDLSFADLRGTTLQGADLHGVDLTGADLGHQKLSDVNLSGARLHKANLFGTELKNAILVEADLSDANLIQANLEGADVRSACLTGAKLRGAYLSSAKFAKAELQGADLRRAIFGGADLSGAWLNHTNLTETKLRGVNLTGSHFNETILADVDFDGALGLEDCEHHGPSVLDFRSLRRSGTIPTAFLQGVGLSEALIDYLPALFARAIEHYSCFISYSTHDEAFVKRLHGDLQAKGVRCWFAPHDLPVGGKLLDEIDAAIRLRDKVLLVLSKQSIASNWVEDEVTKAFEEERWRDQIVLFPVRIDDEVLTTDEAWAAKIRSRLIGDFTQWKKPKIYEENLKRIVRDLLMPKDKISFEKERDE